MPKKKKTQLKPVARGFTTTSIPKKAVQVEESSPPADEVPPSESEGLVTEAAETSADQAAVRGALRDSANFDAEQDEQPFLQTLVDKYQEKTEKELSRAIKAIEVDGRISRGFNTVEVDSMLVEEIIRLHLEEEQSRARLTYIDHTKEKAVTRLAVTYGILRRLGFSEDWVEQCLRTIPGIELDEALDWLIVHCPDNELASSMFLKDRTSQSLNLFITQRMITIPPSQPTYLIPEYLFFPRNLQQSHLNQSLWTLRKLGRMHLTSSHRMILTTETKHCHSKGR
ncbi:hypothetical protein EV363DRAFT_331186 [Boletus edulis]|nr:hypothetical protein EV363DRAFT_331186 [Boletus edulis]